VAAMVSEAIRIRIIFLRDRECFINRESDGESIVYSLRALQPTFRFRFLHLHVEHAREKELFLCLFRFQLFLGFFLNEYAYYYPYYGAPHNGLDL
jgi:hypothetical protein